MHSEVFDAECGCLGTRPGSIKPVAPESLHLHMERMGITRAAVRYGPAAVTAGFELRNEALFSLARDDARIYPCPSVVPAGGEYGTEEEAQADKLIRFGARFVTIEPRLDCWLPEPFACRRMFKALEDRKLPLICSNSVLPIEKIALFAGIASELPFVLTGLPYRSARDISSLLDCFGNVYVSLGNNFSLQGGVEYMVKMHGPERFVLGTGFPEAEAACAITQLAYAAIPENARKMIAHENLARLAEKAAK